MSIPIVEVMAARRTQCAVIVFHVVTREFISSVALEKTGQPQMYQSAHDPRVGFLSPNASAEGQKKAVKEACGVEGTISFRFASQRPFVDVAEWVHTLTI
jgi:hypothetical protein